MTRLAVWVAISLSTVLVGAGVQDPKPSPATPTPTPAVTPQPTPTPVDIDKLAKEQIPITGRVETWYQVVQESEPIGFAHEIIAKIAQNKYSYFFECDFDFVPKGESNVMEYPHISMQVSGELGETFDPIRLRMNRSVGSDTYETEISSAPDKRLVSMRSGDSTSTQYEFELAETQLFFHPITIYRLRQRGEMGKAGKRKIARPTGNGNEVEQVEFQVSSPEAREYLDKKNIVAITVKAPERGGAPSEFVVDRYGRILERRGFYGLGGVKMVISKDPSQARGGAGALSQKGRRDPFKQQLTSLGSGSTTGGPTPVGTDTPEPTTLPTIQPGEVQSKLEEATVMIRDLRQFVAETAETDAANTYQAFLKAYEQLRQSIISDPIKLTGLDKLKYDAEEVYGGVDKLLGQTDTMLVSIDDYMNALDVESIKKRIADMKKLKSRREFINEDVRLGKLIEKIRQAEKKQEQAVARLDLSKKRIDLTGVVVSSQLVRESIRMDFSIAGARVQVDEPVQLKWTTAYAVINDEYYREGDIVRGEDVKVDKILRQAVQISYKDETREVPIKKETKQ